MYSTVSHDISKLKWYFCICHEEYFSRNYYCSAHIADDSTNYNIWHLDANWNSAIQTVLQHQIRSGVLLEHIASARVRPRPAVWGRTNFLYSEWNTLPELLDFKILLNLMIKCRIRLKRMVLERQMNFFLDSWHFRYIDYCFLMNVLIFFYIVEVINNNKLTKLKFHKL